MHYEFSCNITEQDYLELNEFNILHSKALKKAYNIEHYLLPVLTIFLWVLFYFLGLNKETLIFTAWLYGALALAWLLSYRKIFKSKLKRQLKLAKKSGKSLFFPNTIAQFYDDHIVKDSGAQKFEISYDAVKRLVILGDKMIFMFTDTQNTVVVPQNVFDSEEQKNEFISFLERKTVKSEFFNKV